LLTSSTSVLIVDDSPIDRVTATRLLEQEGGYELVEAGDGDEALELIEGDLPDLVVTDMQMPKIGGLELIKAISERYPQLPVILITSRGSEQIAVQALECGAASYVPKARLADDLVPVVNRVLMASRTRALEESVKECLVTTDTHFELTSDPELVVAASDVLAEMLQTAWRYPSREVLRVRMTLEETLVNAIYHGNLEMDHRLREINLELYHELSDSRVAQVPYCDRTISVHVREKKDTFTWQITDQGRGFDPGPYLEAEESSMLEQPFGRGILLMRTVMDEVKFNAAGNSVCLTLYRNSDLQADGSEPLSDDVSDAGFVLDSEGE